MKYAHFKVNINNLFEIKFKNGIFLLYMQQEVFIDILFISDETNNQQKTRLLTGFSYFENVELNLRQHPWSAVFWNQKFVGFLIVNEFACFGIPV